MDIVSFVADIVASITGAPEFIHGEKSWQNLQDEVVVTNGIVYLDEPITSNDILHQSGYLEETYPLRLLFAKKSELDYTPDQLQNIIQPCREMRREFLVRLMQSPTVRSINNVRTIDVLRAFDLNVTGCILQVDLTPLSRDSNCYPDLGEETDPEVPGSDVDAQFVIEADSNYNVIESMWNCTLKRWWTQGDGTGPYIDVYAEPHFSRLRALNFRGANIMGDSENHLTFVLSGDYFADGDERIGNGLNCNIKDWGDPNTTCELGETGGVGDNVCCKDWGIALIPLMIDLCKELDYKVAWIANAGHYDKDALIANLTNWINTKGVTVERVFAGLENNTPGYDNAAQWPNAQDDYVPRAQTINDDVHESFQLIPIAGDTRPVENGNQSDWNDPLEASTLAEMRCYLQDDSFGFNADDNTIADAKNVVDTLLPARLAQWLAQFPDKKLAIAQWGALGNSMLASLYLADFHRQLVLWNADNGDFISCAYLFRPAFWKLNKSKPKNIYYSALLTGMMYKYAGSQVVDVTTDEDLRPLCFKNGNRYLLRLVNYSADTISIDSFKLSTDHPVSIQNCFAQYGTSETDTQPKYEELTANPVIKPYSVTFIELA